MPPRSYPVSIVILTLNEESRLPQCLASIAGANDIVVLDSGSSDRTVDLARAAGARVFTHPFKDFADQRNHAHAAIEFKNPWVFHLDADEQLTPELLSECANLSASAPFDGYFAAPRMMFHNRWLRRCTDFPAWQARCVRATGFQFIQVGHGQRESPAMRMGYLRSSYLHDISVANPADWESKHRRYAKAEAARFWTERRPFGDAMRTNITGPALERRRALKHLSYLLPCRPLARFFYQYILRGGFLDGTAAFRYCCLLARYEKFAVDEIRRLKNPENG